MQRYEKYFYCFGNKPQEGIFQRDKRCRSNLPYEGISQRDKLCGSDDSIYMESTIVFLTI